MTRSDAQMLTHLAKAVCSRKILEWPQQSRMTSGKIICQRESANVHAASQYPVENHRSPRSSKSPKQDHQTRSVGESESLKFTDPAAHLQACPDQVAVALAARDGTTRARHSSDSRHRQHTAPHHRAAQHLEHLELEHLGLEHLVHFEVVHMIAGYSADSDHCIGHHDSLRLLTGDSSLPVVWY